MLESKKEHKDNNRRLGIFVVILLWGMVLVMVVISIIRGFAHGQAPEARSIPWLVIAIIAIAGSLLGDRIRIITGVIGLLGMVAGLLMMIVSTGLGTEDGFIISLAMIVFGLATGVLLLFSEAEPTEP